MKQITHKAFLTAFDEAGEMSEVFEHYHNETYYQCLEIDRVIYLRSANFKGMGLYCVADAAPNFKHDEIDKRLIECAIFDTPQEALAHVVQLFS